MGLQHRDREFLSSEDDREDTFSPHLSDVSVAATMPPLTRGASPDQHHDTLYIEFDTTVPAGTDWQFDRLAVEIAPVYHFEGASFYNYGKLTVTTAAGAVGVRSDPLCDYSTNVIENFGVIQVSAAMSHQTGHAPVAIGIQADQSMAPLYNEAGGQIIVQGEVAYGVFDTDFLNPIHNDGLIQVTGIDQTAGLYLHNAGWIVTNGGEITVHGGNGNQTYGVLFGSGGSSLVNDGEISVTADSNTDGTVGIQWYVTSTTSIINHGTISAATAIMDGGDWGWTTIDNDGTINGAIKSFASNDTIVNLGHINGAITLGSGDDVVDNEHGLISGLVDGGSGDNTALCNADDATTNINFSVGDTTHPMTLPDGTVIVNFQNFGVVTGSGNDTFLMGAGDDVMQGCGGTDTLNGVSGTDTASYSEATGGVTVSLAVSGPQSVGGGCGTDTLISVENLTGSAFNDTLTGNGGNNVITTGAGIDTIAGGGGDDTIVMSEFLTGADRIDGGTGNDEVVIDGDYAGGLTLTSAMLKDVETLTVGTVDAYTFSLTAAADLVTAGHSLTVDASLSLGVYFDGSAATGSLTLLGSEDGDDVLIGGSGDDFLEGQHDFSHNVLDGTHGGNDTIICSPGANLILMGAAFTAADKIEGFNYLVDKVVLDGDYSAGVVFTPQTMTAISTIQLTGGYSYSLTINAATVYFLTTMTVDASGLGTGNRLVFDASAAVNAGVSIVGGAGDDVMTGGTWIDTMQGNDGNDMIDVTRDLFATVGGGNDDDTILVGASLSTNWTIDGGQGVDTLKIDGDYSAGLVFTNKMMTNIENMVLASGHSYRFTTNDANVAAGQTLTIDGSHLGATNLLTFNGSSETDGEFIILGGAGNDTLSGGAGDDTLIAPKGGNDTLSGGAGNDTIRKGAFLTAADKIDGGSGADQMWITGDYSHGLTFSATTMVNVETLVLGAGYSYTLTTNNATVAAGQTLTVDGSALGAAFAVTFDGSAETDGKFVLQGGAGKDSLTGGAGDDTVSGGTGDDTLVANNGGNDTVRGGDGNDTIRMGAALTAADSIDGGTGNDTVWLYGNYTGLIFSATTMVNVETIILGSSHSYTLTTNAATVAAGETLTVNGSALKAGDVFVFDGSAETDGRFTLLGGSGNDVLTGGADADHFDLTKGGNDAANGGAGDDTFAVGATLSVADKIDGGTGTDKVTLNGDYSAGLTFSATTMVNVETLQLLGTHGYTLTTSDATVGTGQVLAVIGKTLTHGLTFDGSAEQDGSFVVTGGKSDDTLIGGARGDTLSGGAGNDTIMGGGGGDILSGGSGHNSFVYNAIADATGRGFDTISQFDVKTDAIDLWFQVTGLDHTVSGGALSQGSFDTDLAAALGANQLHAGHAVLFAPTSGDYVGETFLVVDANGIAGYQAGQDLVIAFDHTAHLDHFNLTNFTESPI